MAYFMTSLPFGLGREILAKQDVKGGAWFSYSSMPIAMNHLKINGYKMI